MTNKIIIIDCEKYPKYYKKVNMRPKDFIEKSYLIGNTIILGKYKNKQRKIISYYHELGHLKTRKHYLEKLEQEINAWKVALDEIPIKNITKENVKYILHCLETYIPHINLLPKTHIG